MLSLESIVLHVANMKTDKFVDSVNKYAIATRYNKNKDNVCEYSNEKIIKILKPDYFGFGEYFGKIRVGYLKRFYIKSIINSWSTMEKEDQETLINAFMY